MHFFTQKIPFKTQISKRSTHTDLHHPPLHLAQFFSLESLKISSAYSKTSLGLKMEKFFQTIVREDALPVKFASLKSIDRTISKLRLIFIYFFSSLLRFVKDLVLCCLRSR